MKELKVFIFDNHCFERIEQELEKIIISLKLRCKIFSTGDYSVAREKVSEEKFDIISLCNLLDVVDEDEAHSFAKTTLSMNSNSIIFLMLDEPTIDAFKFAKENNINLVFSMGRNFFGIPEVIFNYNDIFDLKHAITESWMNKYRVADERFFNSICVFSQAYIKPHSSEELAIAACDDVVFELEAKEIEYSVVDHNSRIDISVADYQKDEAIKTALNSNFKSWYDYVVKNLL